MLITFVIPAAPYHEAVVERATASILIQTVACAVVVIRDHDRRGAGWARNQGLAQVDTPFVVFLDADDWIAPTWAEECLRAYDGKHYIYTDHFRDDTGEHVGVSDTAWDGKGSWHVITALLPTSSVKRVGGFDETLDGFEDTDFYWKLTRSGVWGRRLAKPLFYYGDGGRRAKAFRDHPDRDAIVADILKRYRGLPMAEDCGGCGANPNLPSIPTNEHLEGDVLAAALWRGNRNMRGRATGRLYRGGWNKPLWVHPADIDSAPQMFSRIVDLPPALSEEDIDAFKTFTRAVLGGDTAPVPVPEGATVTTEIRPNVGRVLELYGRKLQPGAFIDTTNWP